MRNTETMTISLPPAMANLSYDQYQSIRFRANHALWADSGLAFRLQFFQIGRTFTDPVHLYEVDGGRASEILSGRRLRLWRWRRCASRR